MDPSQKCRGGQGAQGVLRAGKRVVQVAAGSQHTCAVRVDKSIICFGLGNDGRLGYGNWAVYIVGMLSVLIGLSLIALGKEQPCEASARQPQTSVSSRSTSRGHRFISASALSDSSDED